MTRPEEIADVLFRAADRVQFKGWTRFTYAVDAGGRCVGAKNRQAVAWCANGAMRAETSVSALNQRAQRALAKHLGQNVMAWNDQPTRTAGEVADTMRRCAKELLEQASA